MKRLFLAVMIVMIFSAVAVRASEESDQIMLQIQTAEAVMADLNGQGLSTMKYNDTLLQAKQLYEAQLTLENSGGKPDYTIIYEKLQELQTIKSDALRNLDELNALEKTIQDTEGNMTEVEAIFAEAKTEFNNERYDKSFETIERAYEKMSELEALDTKFKAFYEATSRDIVSFLEETWRPILVIIIALFTAFILTHKRIACFLIKRRIKKLELRKLSVLKLTGETQGRYFDKRDISEMSYKIKMNKYGEIMRDIDRQIPLLREELEIRSKKKI